MINSIEIDTRNLIESTDSFNGFYLLNNERYDVEDDIEASSKIIEQVAKLLKADNYDDELAYEITEGLFIASLDLDNNLTIKEIE